MDIQDQLLSLFEQVKRQEDEATTPPKGAASLACPLAGAQLPKGLEPRPRTPGEKAETAPRRHR
jgi:hypothetical protein